MYANFVHATNDASHYTKPPTGKWVLLSGNIFLFIAWRSSLVYTASLTLTPCFGVYWLCRTLWHAWSLAVGDVTTSCTVPQYWLHVQQRMEFKLVVLVHKALDNNHAPQYLKMNASSYNCFGLPSSLKIVSSSEHVLVMHSLRKASRFHQSARSHPSV